jgi:hypothetical protein
MPLYVQTHFLVLAGVACIALAYASLALGAWQAGERRADAEVRLQDTAQILSAPPASVDELKTQVATVNGELAALQRPAAASIDPSSDETTALLVRRAQAAGLAVSGIARLNNAQTKINDVAYDVQGTRVSVDAASPQLINAFLVYLDASDPGLVASLQSMTISETGTANAEIVFSVFTKAAATPTAGAPTTGGPR